MSHKISRKDFLFTTGTALTGLSALGYSSISGSNEALNIGVIGTGSRGVYLARVMKQIPDIRLVACCDILPGHLRNGLEHAAANARGYDEYNKLLEDREVDAVVIATPLHLHYQMARDAVEAGKHVYCEKNLSHSIGEAQKLAVIVNSSDVIFQVGFQHRYNPLFNRVYDIINNGSAGDISYIECTWNRNGDWRRPVPDRSLERLINWRMYREYSQGLMAELCSHQIDIVNWILGEVPEKVTGFGGIDYWKDGRETFDNVHAVFEYPSTGIKGIFNAITTNAHEGFSMRFYGKNITIEIRDDSNPEAFIYAESTHLSQAAVKEQDADAITKPTNKAWNQGEAVQIGANEQGDLVPTREALKDFVDSIRTKKTPLSNIKNGHDTAICVLMGNNAMRSNSIEYWKDDYAI